MRKNEFKEYIEETYDEFVRETPLSDEEGTVNGWLYEAFSESEYPPNTLYIPRHGSPGVYRNVDTSFLQESLEGDVDIKTIERFRELLINLFFEQFGPEKISKTPDPESAREWVTESDRFTLEGDSNTIVRANR